MVDDGPSVLDGKAVPRQDAGVGAQRRFVVWASLVAFATLLVAVLPIKWHHVQWGTVPEWIGAVALVVVAAAVWRLVHATERARNRHDSLR